MFRNRWLIALGAIVMAFVLVSADAHARVGGGFSGGSRGMRTFSAPPATPTAPTAAPIQRSITQPGNVAPNGQTGIRPGLFGGGLFGGLAAGFLGAGLFGLLFGHGLFGGMAGFTSPVGEQLAIAKSDYDGFERLLGDIQAGYSTEDLSTLRAEVTPEMLSYFSEQLAANASRGLINRVTDVKLLQGDLAEGWREGNTDYATVGMNFALKDSMVERASGQTVEGGEPSEVTELWTFMRARGGNWLLSAIQQT